MKAEDYTIEYCPWCDQDVAIRAKGVTACPSCGMPLAPCSVCESCNYSTCPYGCTGGVEDEHKPVTVPPMTEEEIRFAIENC